MGDPSKSNIVGLCKLPNSVSVDTVMVSSLPLEADRGLPKKAVVSQNYTAILEVRFSMTAYSCRRYYIREHAGAARATKGRIDATAPATAMNTLHKLMNRLYPSSRPDSCWWRLRKRCSRAWISFMDCPLLT